MSKEKKTRRRFTEEFKAETVKLVKQSDRSMAGIAMELGIFAVVCNSLGYAAGHDTARLAGPVAGLVLLTFTAARLFASLLREREVSSDTIIGGNCVYLAAGVVVRDLLHADR